MRPQKADLVLLDTDRTRQLFLTFSDGRDIRFCVVLHRFGNLKKIPLLLCAISLYLNIAKLTLKQSKTTETILKYITKQLMFHDNEDKHHTY